MRAWAARCLSCSGYFGGCSDEGTDRQSSLVFRLLRALHRRGHGQAGVLCVLRLLWGDIKNGVHVIHGDSPSGENSWAPRHSRGHWGIEDLHCPMKSFRVVCFESDVCSCVSCLSPPFHTAFAFKSLLIAAHYRIQTSPVADVDDRRSVRRVEKCYGSNRHFQGDDDYLDYRQRLDRKHVVPRVLRHRKSYMQSHISIPCCPALQCRILDRMDSLTFVGTGVSVIHKF